MLLIGEAVNNIDQHRNVFAVGDLGCVVLMHGRGTFLLSLSLLGGRGGGYSRPHGFFL